VIIQKPNNEMRICQDMRQINARTLPMHYRTADVQQILNKAANCKYLTNIDLSSSHWQVKLSESSKQYCSFTTHVRQVTWNVMVQGCKNSSKTMQKLIDKILRGIHNAADSFLDDIIVFSQSFEQHSFHLKEVLDRLRSAKLTAKVSKCQFAMKKVTVLGESGAEWNSGAERNSRVWRNQHGPRLPCCHAIVYTQPARAKEGCVVNVLRV
jgi:hypothetical protein